jgi:hypothetical protein
MALPETVTPWRRCIVGFMHTGRVGEHVAGVCDDVARSATASDAGRAFMVVHLGHCAGRVCCACVLAGLSLTFYSPSVAMMLQKMLT